MSGHLESRDVELDIDLGTQTLTVCSNGDQAVRTYTVSSGANGPGEVEDSGCTPRGRHIIRAKIGAGEPTNTVFRGRRPTGEIYQAGMRDEQPGRDWILTRILWLSGMEPGVNRLGNVDTMRRYIYIHGTPDEVELGTPGSAGCIRMRNTDLLELFDLVEAGTRVTIHE